RSRDVAQVEREERRRERAQDPVAQRQYRRPRPPDLDRHALVPERREETKALEMVEVEMSQEEVYVPRLPSDEVETERPDPGAGIEHQSLAVSRRHLDARGIAAVLDSVRAGRRKRPPATPDLHARRHRASHARRSP